MIRKTAASLEEKVYDELADAILSGKYKKGDALTEAALSSAFGASRTPVRSALHRLAEEGLVEVVGVAVLRQRIFSEFHTQLPLIFAPVAPQQAAGGNVGIDLFAGG